MTNTILTWPGPGGSLQNTGEGVLHGDLTVEGAGTLSGTLSASSLVATSGNLQASVISTGPSSGGDMTFYTAQQARWKITSSGDWVPVSDAAADLGGAATNRVRSLYLSTSAYLGTTSRSLGVQTPAGADILVLQNLTTSTQGYVDLMASEACEMWFNYSRVTGTFIDAAKPWGRLIATAAYGGGGLYFETGAAGSSTLTTRLSVTPTGNVGVAGSLGVSGTSTLTGYVGVGGTPVAPTVLRLYGRGETSATIGFQHVNAAANRNIFYTRDDGFVYVQGPLQNDGALTVNGTATLSTATINTTLNVSGQSNLHYIVCEGLDIGQGPLYFAHSGSIRFYYDGADAIYGAAIRTPNHLHVDGTVGGGNFRSESNFDAGGNNYYFGHNSGIYLRWDGYLSLSHAIQINTAAGGAIITTALQRGYYAPMVNSGQGDFVLGGGNSALFLHPNGSVGLRQDYPTCTFFGFASITVNGVVTNSSRRFKSNIQAIPSALRLVMDPSLSGVHFTYHQPDPAGFETPPVEKFGFLAEPWNAKAPDVVTRDQDGEPTAIDYQQITAILFQAFKEYVAETDARIQKLERICST